jgi:outer membrane lipoprotein-sorting protein
MTRFRRVSLLSLTVSFLTFISLTLIPSIPPARAGAWGQCPARVKRITDQADRITRGSSSKGIMSMKVYKRGTVSMMMKIYSKGREKFLAKILRPSRLRGMSTLKSGDNLWNYLPDQDRIVKLGSSMMGSSWMGSHFTNDDLVKETDYRKHYTCSGYKEQGGYLTVTMKPRPNAPVVWGKVAMRIKVQGTIPQWARYYDERGKLKRTMRFEAVKEMGGRTMPTRMVLQPADAPSERTVVTFHKMKFDVSVPDRLFTLQGLKR